MTGETLHEYDQWLCHYVLGNIRQYMNKPPFAAWVEQQVGPGPLLQYLKEEGVKPLEEQERLLLNDDDLEDLAMSMEGPPEMDREWEPYEQLHGWHIKTLKEVRDELSKQAAENWSSACGRFAQQLEGKRVFLVEGIAIVHDWVRSLRGVLRAMGAIAFLPCPEGQSPTPTCSTPSAQLISPEPSAKQKEADVEVMRKAIAKHESDNPTVPEHRRGRKAQAKVLVKVAHIRPQRGRNALRTLELQGEYSGFARPRPRCYRDGQTNEK